jgi:hypothetical protein
VLWVDDKGTWGLACPGLPKMNGNGLAHNGHGYHEHGEHEEAAVGQCSPREYAGCREGWQGYLMAQFKLLVLSSRGYPPFRCPLGE